MLRLNNAGLRLTLLASTTSALKLTTTYNTFYDAYNFVAADGMMTFENLCFGTVDPMRMSWDPLDISDCCSYGNIAAACDVSGGPSPSAEEPTPQPATEEPAPQPSSSNGPTLDPTEAARYFVDGNDCKRRDYSGDEYIGWTIVNHSLCCTYGAIAEVCALYNQAVPTISSAPIP